MRNNPKRTTMCKAITKKGTICKNNGDPCRVHSLVPIRKAESPIRKAESPIRKASEKCKYLKAGEKCSSDLVVGTKFCKVHNVATSPVVQLSFDDDDADFLRKQDDIQMKIGILLQDINVTSWRFDGSELYIRGGTPISCW